MNAEIGLKDSDRSGVSRILNRIVSDEYVLLVKTKNYHWNVVGPDFAELHKFLDEQYGAVAGFIDDSAERVRSLGEKPVGTLTEFLKLASLKEQPGELPPAREMLKLLLKDHEFIVRNLRKDVDDCANEFHDMGTSDFLTGLMEEHEKMAWMLRSYLE